MIGTTLENGNENRPDKRTDTSQKKDLKIVNYRDLPFFRYLPDEKQDDAERILGHNLQKDHKSRRERDGKTGEGKQNGHCYCYIINE